MMQRRISPQCPRCKSMKTYDVIPGIPDLPEWQQSEDVDFHTQTITIGNARFRCAACRHTWKKYRGKMPYKDIKAVYADAGGFPGPFFQVKVDLSERRIERESNLVPHQMLKDHLDDDEAGWFINELYKCDLINWAEEYSLPDAVDGTHWIVRIEYSTHCEIKTGSNHFPPKWTKFCKTVSMISGGDFY